MKKMSQVIESGDEFWKFDEFSELGMIGGLQCYE